MSRAQFRSHRDEGAAPTGSRQLGPGYYAQRGRGSRFASAREARGFCCVARRAWARISTRRAAMNGAATSTPSIRRRLLLFLLPPLTLLMLVGVFINYRTATIFVRAAYDQKLAEIARDFATQLQQAQPKPLAAPAGILFSIKTPDGQSSAGNPRLPTVPVGSASLTYGDGTLDGRDLRLVTYRVPTAVITVAENE